MKIYVTPGKSRDEIMFREEDGRIYWRPWWKGHWHILILIFRGHDLEYVA